MAKVPSLVLLRCVRIHLELDVFSLQGVGLGLQPLDLLQGALQVHVADVVDRLQLRYH